MEKSAIIFDKVSLVMHDMGPIAKSKRNTQQNYSFRGIEDLMNEFAPIATKHGIFPVTTRIQDITNEPVTSRAGGSGYRTVRRFTFRFYASDGSLVETTADGEAIDYGDKSSNKAYSVAYREAIFKMFIVPFAQDDIENHDHELKEPTEASKHPTRRTSTPVSKSAAARELAAKTRIVALVDKLNDGETPSFATKEEKADYYAAEVQRLTSLSLPLASVEELETIGDELGKLFDNRK
jgi:hypothetical protein